MPSIFYRATAKNFHKIQGSPLAYWVSSNFHQAFEKLPPLSDYAQARQGLATGHNDTFLRFWPEIEISKFRSNCTTRDEASASGAKWFPYNKGGSFRKWYGNQDFVLNWENDGQAIKQKKADDLEAGKCTANNAKCWNQDYYFKSGLSWSGTGIETFGARLSPAGFVFDVKGSTCFVDENKIMTFLSFFNSIVPTEFLKILNPSTEFQAGNIKMLPLSPELQAEANSEAFDHAAVSALELSVNDWNNVETSWNFRDLPLLRAGDWEVEPGQQGGRWKALTLAESWDNYANYCTAAIHRMKALETENNRLWTKAYGLDGELVPDSPENQITLGNANKKKDIIAFLSYAVGCMMGRYSLDAEGLIMANSGETLEDYAKKIASVQSSAFSLKDASFTPDDDGIIPALDDEWFDDDIVGRTKEFLRVTFGDDTLSENIDFIEQSLGKSLRKYFVDDFFKHHIKTYKKRPIYWLVQSPGKSFQALIYLHRYTKDTMNLVLNNYLREFEAKLENRLDHLAHIITSESSSGPDKTKAQKETDKIKASLTELDAWQKDILFPIASQRIELDLDDGVKANYPKLGKTLATIPGVSK